jgi:predicted small secreted protein
MHLACIRHGGGPVNWRTLSVVVLAALTLAACGQQSPVGRGIETGASVTASRSTSLPGAAPGLVEAATTLQDSGDPHLLGTSVEYPTTVYVYVHGRVSAENENLMQRARATGLRVTVVERAWSMDQFERLRSAILADRQLLSELGISRAYVSVDKSGVVVEMVRPSPERAEELRQRMGTAIPISARGVTRVVIPEDEGFAPSIPPMPGPPSAPAT